MPTKFIGVTPVNENAVAGSLPTQAQIPATLIAGTVEIVLGVFNSPNPAVLSFITLIPQAAVASNGTNFATFNLVNRAAGAGTSVLATFNTSATSLVAYVAKTLTPDGTQAAVTPGSVLTLQVTKAASGVVTPPMLAILEWAY
jgi:hypothetical protein